MDQQELEGLERWLNEKWRHGPCPVCGVQAWETVPRLGQITNLDGHGRVPILFIGCRNCGYQIVVNALAAGIRPEQAAVTREGEPVFSLRQDASDGEPVQGTQFPSEQAPSEQGE